MTAPTPGTRRAAPPTPGSRRAAPPAIGWTGPLPGRDWVARHPRTALSIEGLLVCILGGYLAIRTLPALGDFHRALYNDVITQAMGPDRHGLEALFDKGVWPSWLRSGFGGEPYAANIQHGVLYPGNWPFLFLSTAQALDLVVGLHIVLAFFGMWLYLRTALKTSAWAAVLGSVCFGIGSQVLTHSVLGDQLQGVVWAPLVLWGTHLALERGTLRWVVVTAVMTGMQFLAGHPEGWLYTLGAAVLYAAFWVFAEGFGRALLRRRAWHALTRVGGAIVLFALLFAWQLLPTLQLKGQGFRDAGGFDQQYGLPVKFGVDALLPDYGKILYGENQAFVGVAALGLFCLGLVARRRGTLWLRLALATLAALGFVMALGTTNAFYAFFYHHVSIIHSFRVPARWLLLTNVALSVGAALGLDELLRSGVGQLLVRVRQGLLAVLVLLAGGAFAFSLAHSSTDGASMRYWEEAAVAAAVVWLVAYVRRVPRSLLGAAVVVITCLELVNARPTAEYQQKVADIVYDDYGPIMSMISADGGRYLSDAVATGPADRATIPLPLNLKTAREKGYYTTAVAPRITGRPNSQIATLSNGVQGRDGGLMPLARWRDFYESATGSVGDINGGQEVQQPSQLSFAAFDLLGIEWWILPDNINPPCAVGQICAPVPEAPGEADVLRAHGFTQVTHYTFVTLWHRPLGTTARLYHAVDVVPAREDQLARYRAGYDLTARAIVEQPLTLGPAPADPSTEGIEASHPGETTWRLRLTAASPALLEVPEPFYPGWEATVDGHPAKVLAVDTAFRGVVVPAGHHTVVFRYVDHQLRRGLLLAGLTVLGLVASVTAGPYLRRRRRAALPGPDEAGAPIV